MTSSNEDGSVSMEAPLNIYALAAQLAQEGTVTDKVAHGYLPYYDRHLADLRNRLGVPGVLVEIGVADGASLRLWSRWLHGTTIVGIDINARTDLASDLEEPYVHILQGDINHEDSPARVCAWGIPDVVIDDGSHQPDDQVHAFKTLWPLVRPGGWYVIEDLRTCFEPGWGGSIDKPNAAFGRLVGILQAVLVGGEITELHAYEEIVFMRKAS